MFYFWKGILKKNATGRCYLIHGEEERIRRITPVDAPEGVDRFRSGQRVVISGTWDGKRIFAGRIIPVDLPRRRSRQERGIK